MKEIEIAASATISSEAKSPQAADAWSLLDAAPSVESVSRLLKLDRATLVDLATKAANKYFPPAKGTGEQKWREEVTQRTKSCKADEDELGFAAEAILRVLNE